MIQKSAVFFLLPLFAAAFAFADDTLTATEIRDELGWGSLSADGTTIALAKGEDYDSLWLYDIKTAKEKPVLKGRVAHFPRLDPAGRNILFSGEAPYPGIWMIGADGKGLHPLSPKWTAKDSGFGAVWSPDGRTVAWGKDGQIWLSKADGSGAKALTQALVGENEAIGYPIDWMDDKILTLGTANVIHGKTHSEIVGIYIVDALTGKVTDTGLRSIWAQFCESTDYLMYSGSNSPLFFWSVPDKAEADDVAPLEMSVELDYPNITRSADSSILLFCETDPNGEYYLHLYLVDSNQ